jgi:hypothetical protein
MKTLASAKRKPTTQRLTCSDCGNTQRFIEVMAEEAHLVDGNLNYIHLLEASVDHYVCCECGKSLQAPSLNKAGRMVSRQSMLA